MLLATLKQHQSSLAVDQSSSCISVGSVVCTLIRDGYQALINFAAEFASKIGNCSVSNKKQNGHIFQFQNGCFQYQSLEGYVELSVILQDNSRSLLSLTSEALTLSLELVLKLLWHAKRFSSCTRKSLEVSRGFLAGQSFVHGWRWVSSFKLDEQSIYKKDPKKDLYGIQVCMLRPIAWSTRVSCT